MTTRAKFFGELVSLAQEGRPTPCTGSRRDWWTSDLRSDQARAVAECRTCVALALCTTYIDQNPQPAGVYAARTELDRNPRPRNTTKGS